MDHFSHICHHQHAKSSCLVTVCWPPLRSQPHPFIWCCRQGLWRGHVTPDLQCRYHLVWSMRHEAVLPPRLMLNTEPCSVSCCFFHCSNKTGIKVGIHVVVKCVFQCQPPLHHVYQHISGPELVKIKAFCPLAATVASGALFPAACISPHHH